MRGPLYLAWRYLDRHRIKTAVLTGSIALIAFLPLGLRTLVEQSADELMARAESTPLLIGARGSPLELVLNALYFESDPPVPTSWSQHLRVEESGFAEPIPLHVRFRAREHPVVGTSLEYFEFRDLHLASGRAFSVIGECVLGARVAGELGLGTGDSIVTSPESAFDIAGVYPLRLRVVGVLEAAHTPDDEAVFVDVKTAWIVQGLGHGHQDLAEPGAKAAVLSRDGTRVTANASVVQFNEITAENMASFHFHGDLSRYPLTAVIALPRGEKERVLLMGRFAAAEDEAQIALPMEVLTELLDTVFTVEAWVRAAIGVASLATLAIAVLVFALSIRARRREIDTMIKIGGARSSVFVLLAAEIAFVLLAGLLIAGLLTLLVQLLGPATIRALVLV